MSPQDKRNAENQLQILIGSVCMETRSKYVCD